MTAVRGARWPGATWLTLVSAAAVVAINLAGLWEIAAARRGALESARRMLALETEARAGALASRLAQARGELAFMAGSPVFFNLQVGLASSDPRQARWRRLESEGSLLLFLRSHPEVMRAEVLGSSGAPLLQAARRGGVPVLWASAGGEGGEPARRAIDPVRQPVEGRFEPRLGTRTVEGAVTMEATIDAARLLDGLPTGDAGARACVLRDARGATLATGAEARGAPERLAAQAAVAADGWSAPGPWGLLCGATRTPPFSLLEPMAARTRTTLLLNLMVMGLAVALGLFAIHQARGRQQMEAMAREEARVRELERQLFHTERLATVGRLAAGMAHEINNPLEGMSNYLALARDALRRGDLEGAGRRLGAVEEGLKRTGAVVGQVLAHSDPAKTPPAPVDLVAVARQTVQFVGSRPEFAAIRFVLDLPDDLPDVSGRPTLLGQLFLNLVINACEAQPKGGEVRLQASARDGRVVVEIGDRGPGVPEGERERIFEPFYSTKSSSGLGLSVCHAIVSQHGGAIEVAERSGGGATFRISLPAADAAGERGAAEGGAARPAGGAGTPGSGGRAA